MSQPREKPAERTRVPAIGFCQKKNRLLDEYLNASREVMALQNEQTQAVIQADADFPRFDVLLHLAQDRKEMAKYAWIAQVESHGGGRPNKMRLTLVEKERVSDSRMKLQSVAHSLNHIDPEKVAGFEELQERLDNAEKSLSDALRGQDEARHE